MERTMGKQGPTIDEPYNIHEFDKMDQNLKYIALNRSKMYEYINIMNIEIAIQQFKTIQ